MLLPPLWVAPYSWSVIQIVLYCLYFTVCMDRGRSEPSRVRSRDKMKNQETDAQPERITR